MSPTLNGNPEILSFECSGTIEITWCTNVRFFTWDKRISQYHSPSFTGSLITFRLRRGVVALSASMAWARVFWVKSWSSISTILSPTQSRASWYALPSGKISSIISPPWERERVCVCVCVYVCVCVCAYVMKEYFGDEYNSYHLCSVHSHVQISYHLCSVHSHVQISYHLCRVHSHALMQWGHLNGWTLMATLLGGPVEVVGDRHWSLREQGEELSLQKL